MSTLAVEHARRLLFVTLFGATILSAQTIGDVATGVDPSEVVVGEEAAYIVQIQVLLLSENNTVKPDAPAAPVVDGCEIKFTETRAGSFASETTIRNGRMTRSMRQTFQFVYSLRVSRPGSFVVPPYETTILDQKVKVPAARFVASAEAPGNKFSEISVEASTTTPYVNQAVKLRFSFNAQKRLVGKPKVTIPWAASPNGFFGEPVPAPDPRQANRLMEIALNGQPWALPFQRGARSENESFVFERTIYPLAPGRVEISGSSIVAELGTRFRQDFFGTLVPEDSVRAVLSSKPLIFDVRPAPEAGRPASFTGIVGDFRCELKYGRTEIRAGDGVTLSLSVRGRGDLEGLVPPDLSGFEGFNVYPPDKQVVDEGDEKVLRLSWLLVPENLEKKEMPRFEFSWFQPATATYQTIAVGPAPLILTGALKDEGIFGGVRTDARGPSEIRTLAEGIRPLKPRPGSPGGPGQIPGLPVLLLSAAAVVSGVWFANRVVLQRQLEHGDERLVRRRQASRAATQRLMEARALVGQGRDFYAKLARSLSGFVADKIGVPPASVSMVNAAELLGAAGADESLRERVTKQLESFDALQYSGAAPDHVHQDAALKDVESLIHELDRRIKGGT